MGGETGHDLREEGRIVGIAGIAQQLGVALPLKAGDEEGTPRRNHLHIVARRRLKGQTEISPDVTQALAERRGGIVVGVARKEKAPHGLSQVIGGDVDHMVRQDPPHGFRIGQKRRRLRIAVLETRQAA